MPCTGINHETFSRLVDDFFWAEAECYCMWDQIQIRLSLILFCFTILGTEPGTVVVTRNSVNGLLEPQYEQVTLN